MANLDCAVNSCAYNKDKCCCKGDILVGRKDACCDKDTCCESFANQDRERITSSLEHPSRVINIDCEAEQCIYNSNYKCEAEHVDIRGCNAAGCRETSCATFTAR